MSLKGRGDAVDGGDGGGGMGEEEVEVVDWVIFGCEPMALAAVLSERESILWIVLTCVQ